MSICITEQFEVNGYTFRGSSCHPPGKQTGSHKNYLPLKYGGKDGGVLIHLKVVILIIDEEELMKPIEMSAFGSKRVLILLKVFATN